MAKRKRKIREATELEREQVVAEWQAVPESNRSAYDRHRVASEPRAKVLDLQELTEVGDRLRTAADEMDETVERLVELNRPGIMVDGVGTLLKQLYGIERRIKLIFGATLPLCHWDDRLTNVD